MSEAVSRARREDGFTLIELLIVIVVLGILAAIVLFAVGNTRDEAQTAGCKAEYKTVASAVEAFRVKTGAAPGSTSALTTAGNNQFLKTTPTYYSVNTGGAIQLTTAGTSAGCAASY